MRLAQYRILTRLLEVVNVPDYIHAFEKGRSIPEMASIHVNKHVVISLDLKDFFGSIKQYYLEQMFYHLGVGHSVAKTLSELCTYKARVPQGALTSPKISNLITMLTFGPTLKDYCDTNGLTLSIYADDITISSTTPLEPNSPLSVENIISFVTQVVKEYRFTINSKKTKVMTKNQRQYVCGTVVNEKVNLIKKERHTLRAIIHNCDVNGLEVEAAKGEYTPEEFFSKIMGRVNWWCQLNPTAGERYKQQLKSIYEKHLGQSIVKDITEESVDVVSLETPTSVPWS